MNEPDRECAHYQRQLLLLRDADRPGGQPLAVADHLDGCSACRDEYQELVDFEENIHLRLASGDCLTEDMDARLRQTFRTVARRVEGTHRARHFGARTWSSVTGVAAMLMIAILVTFALNPAPNPATASIYSSERSESGALTKGDEYRLVLKSVEPASVYLVNVDSEAATLVFPYRTETGFDYLGYSDARFTAGESRIVPHLDSGAVFTVTSSAGTTEHYFVVSASKPPSLDVMDAELASIEGVDNVRAWLEERFDTISHFEFEVE